MSRRGNAEGRNLPALLQSGPILMGMASKGSSFEVTSRGRSRCSNATCWLWFLLRLKLWSSSSSSATTVCVSHDVEEWASSKDVDEDCVEVS